MITFNNQNLCEYCFEPITSPSGICSVCKSQYDARNFPGALAVGNILHGEYLVGKVLGKGGFGVTYLCYDLKGRKKVAVKEYFPQSLAQRDSGHKTIINTHNPEIYESGAQKFYKEAKLLYECRSIPEIVHVEKLFPENNTMYFAMEYLVGSNLESYFRNDPHPQENLIIYIAMQVLKSLRMIHGRDEPILHLDISPDNIIFCDSGEVKLIDFGASKAAVGTDVKTMKVFLKTGFAPIEQYNANGKHGPWTDIYAMGATMYYLLTHRVPPESVTRLEYDTLDLSGISPGLAAVIRKMMAVKHSERYQNADEVIAALIAVQRNTFVTDIKTPSAAADDRESVPQISVRNTAPSHVRPEILLLGIISFVGCMILFCYMVWLLL